MLDADEPISDEHEGSGDREITLSNPALLGIFFGCVLVCGLFFGFGYSMGRRAPAASQVSGASPSKSALSKTTTSPAPDASAPTNNNPRVRAQTDSDSAPASSADGSPAIGTKPSAIGAAKSAAKTQPAAQSPAKPSTSTTATVPAKAPAVAPPANGAKQYMVQVAAVAASHKGDADTLVASLRKKGYSAIAIPSSAENLVRVQIGPFADSKSANEMRQKLLDDGYNSIVK